MRAMVKRENRNRLRPPSRELTTHVLYNRTETDAHFLHRAFIPMRAAEPVTITVRPFVGRSKQREEGGYFTAINIKRGRITIYSVEYTHTHTDDVTSAKNPFAPFPPLDLLLPYFRPLR